jgi:hypothetical protein
MGFARRNWAYYERLNRPLPTKRAAQRGLIGLYQFPNPLFRLNHCLTASDFAAGGRQKK